MPALVGQYKSVEWKDLIRREMKEKGKCISVSVLHRKGGAEITISWTVVIGFAAQRSGKTFSVKIERRRLVSSCYLRPCHKSVSLIVPIQFHLVTNTVVERCWIQPKGRRVTTED
jgi:hypothetical protein